MARIAPLPVIILAQSLSASSELLGQRIMQCCHGQSSVRMLISMSMYCSLQAVIVLSAAELLLPLYVTGGQGPLSMWNMLSRHPGLWLNAAVNGLYLLSITVLLREAVGPLYVVFAFLCAAVLLGVISGGAQAASTWGAALLGGLGAMLVLWPRDSSLCMTRWTWRVLCSRIGWTDNSARPRTALDTSESESLGDRGSFKRAPEEVDGVMVDSEDEIYPLTASECPVPVLELERSICDSDVQPATASSSERDTPSSTDRAVAASGASPMGALLRREFSFSSWISSASTTIVSIASLRYVSVAVAFVTLALTAAAGISFATYYQRVAGLNGFGYTAIDQVLLPLSALPLAAVLDRSRRLRFWIGEPPWSTTQTLPPSFLASLSRAFKEVFSTPSKALSVHSHDAALTGSVATDMPNNSVILAATGSQLRSLSCAICQLPWPFVLTLVPYHGLEFLRSFLLFFLVTSFDLDATYLQMTLVRVILCWGGTLLACTLLRDWIRVSRGDADLALSPVSLAATFTGSALMISAVTILRM